MKTTLAVISSKSEDIELSISDLEYRIVRSAQAE